MSGLLIISSMLGGCTSSAEKYIQLGNYKGVEYTAYVITDSDVEAAVNSKLEENPVYTEVTDRGAEEGDVVNIDFVCYHNGEITDNGSDDNVDCEIGSGLWLDGFEDGLIGARAGDELSLDLEYSDSYTANPELAGEAVTFEVTVNSVQSKSIPELTDDFVKSVSEISQTTDEYYDEVRAELESSYEEDYISEVWDTVTENTTVTEYPEDKLDEYIEKYTDDVEDLCEVYGCTADDYYSEYYGRTVEEYAQYIIKEELIVEAVAAREDITVSDDDYAEKLSEYMENAEYDDEEEYIEDAGGEEALKYYFLRDMVAEFIFDNAVAVDSVSVSE
ncbi:MAG: FKBP-type peptidyl-prolyl cis-trans isomerase [Clostridiales bacterium]|nr:FKBP-type peptidyl-prolyl cis-trans isomerase [Clostridiales bacterium]